jgi:[pyruvate, water dikinase]-phosphate phosphotransferase / [pyruvate, water dikinase] kinase
MKHNLSNSQQLLIFVSDSTGVASETLGLTLMTQFGDYSEAQNETLPFIKNIGDALEQADLINSWKCEYKEIIVFSTFVDKTIREFFKTALTVPYFDFFDLILPHVSQTLNKSIVPLAGNRHLDKKELRADAIDYALSFDDGQKLDYDEADIILIGLSRSGKTPTALWLALHYGLKAANYPITDDDFNHKTLPQGLTRNLHKCVLLVQSAERLSKIRQERYKNSQYASLEKCTEELKKLNVLAIIKNVPKVDVSNKSVEEIAANALKLTNIHPKGRF